MIKNDYITRAQKTAVILAKYLDEVGYDEKAPVFTKNECFFRAVKRLNLEKHRRIEININGATRNVIITSDYVIKMDKVEKSRWGTSKNEYKAYEKLMELDKDYLVAPITPFKCGHYNFYIMPRCNSIGTHEIDDFPEDDCEFIYDYFDDIHCDNIGKFHGKLVLIDYAMNYL